MKSGMKRVLIFVLTMAVLAGITELPEVKAEEASISITEGDFDYTVSGSQATITKYKGSASDVVVPNMLGGYSVIGIGRDAFYSCSSLSSVTIPEGVTSIGQDAFRGCSSLSSVTIPEGVTSIGSGAFRDCKSLSSVTIPEGVTSIGNTAFGDCRSLSSVTIPESVISIGQNAFTHCSSLTGNIVIPRNVMSLGPGVFAYCTQMTGLSVAEDNAYYCSDEYGNIYNKNRTKIINGSQWAESVTIPEGVTSIGQEAFCGCSSLSSVTIPEDVTSIGDWAFCDCSSLTSVTIPEGVTSIGDWAFYGCSRLSSVTIPKGVTSIGDWVFHRCSLSSVTIPEGVTSIGSGAFSNCSSLSSVTIPEGVTSIGDQSFCDCSSLTSVTIPEGVTSIGKHVFYGCNSLTSVTIPEGVTSIGDQSFCDCSSLTSVTIPEGVTSIGQDAFHGCSSLSSVTIPKGVTSIGSRAFDSCSSLSSVIIPEGVTSIGDWAFNDCSSLSSVTIPEGVTSIGEVTFQCCKSLSSVTIPEGVTSIGKNVFYGCNSLTSVTIPEGVTSIGDSAFMNCSSLHAVIVPKSVKSIGRTAFYDCGILRDVYYRGSEEDWNKIRISNYNESLINAKIYYNFTDSEMPEIHTGTVWKSDMENHWRECRCGKRIEEAVHTEDSGMVTKEPTETETGLRTYKCSVCGYVTRTEAIAVLPPSHTHTYGTDWKSDMTTHWKECSCGEKTENAAHTEDAGTVTKEATETETGIRAYKCVVCGYVTRTEEIAVLPPSHTHTYGTDWKSDATTHWKECSCGEKTENAAHTEDAGTVTKEATETETGIRTYKCVVCGYVTRTEAIAVLPPSHTHVYGTDWKSDMTTHWKECSCGEKTGNASHTEDAGTVTKEATETETGIRTYKCVECGYVTRTEEIEKHAEGFFEKGNETTTEVETPPEAVDIPEDDRILSITINPAFNMKHKDGSDVELDLSKIEIKAKEIYDEAGLKRAEAALGEILNGNKKYNLLDLTLLYNGKDFSNGYVGLVKVIIPLPKGHRDKTFSCYRLIDGKKELIPGEQTEDSYIIYLEHFSEYALVADGPEEPHTHVYSTAWKSDATGHWKECACNDKAEESVHTQDAGTVTKEATKTEPGIRAYRCSVCGYLIKTEEIAILPADEEPINKKIPAATVVTKAQKKKNQIIINKKVSFKIIGNSLVVTWNKLSGADGYDIYVAFCGDEFKEITASVGKNKSSSVIRKLNGMKINGGKTYKVQIKAYRLLQDGKKQYIGTSAIMHVAGSQNKTTTNAKSISLKKKAYALKKGKSAKICATIIKADKKKELLSKKHKAELSYVSSDETIATVTATGKIKAKKRGKCIIYVRALNGISKEIKVTVK